MGMFKRDVMTVDKNDLMQGHVEWYYSDGSAIIGQFLNDKEIGLWIHYDKDNKKTKMIFNII